MATIVDTLFGVSPERLEQQRAAAADARALAFAQLDPFQQANFAIGRGASGLAGALGGALGGQDPELQRVTMRQQIARQINPSDPATIQQGIVALQQAGDTEGAMLLNSEYQKMQESAALIGQREAAARASLAAATREKAPPTTNEITNARAFASRAGPEGSPEYNAAFNAKLDELTAPKEAKGPGFGADAERTSKAMFGKPFADLTTAEAAEVNKDLLAQAKATAPSTTVKLPPQQTAEQSARGKMLVENFETISNTATVGAKTLPALESNLAILNKGFDTGFGTTTQAAAARVLGALGVQNAKDFATSADVFLANASSAVLQKQLEQKGPQTEADAQRITQTGAQLGNTAAANKFLLTVAREQIRRDVEQAEFYRKWFTKNKTYDGAEDAWLSGEGGKSLFERPELRSYSAPASSAAGGGTLAEQAAAILKSRQTSRPTAGGQ
jgi:hypothetical protein